MKRMTAICMPALMLGAAAFVTPALADDTNATAGAQQSANSSTAQPAEGANVGSAQPAQNADNSALSAQQSSQQSAMNGQTGTSQSGTNASMSSGNTQMAMNTTGNAADLSSIPDNRHKYSRAKRNADNRSEDQTTKELNQKEASLSGNVQ